LKKFGQANGIQITMVYLDKISLIAETRLIKNSF
jgi:hypothetical protein